MDDVILRGIACLATAFLFCIATLPLLGALQQSGYKNGTFLRWLKNKDNLHYNRLCVLALCLGLSATVTSLCFSFLGTRAALAVSAIPFLGILLAFCAVGKKYGLKVPTRATGRCKRLFVVYFFVCAVIAYAWIALLWALIRWNSSAVYALIGYLPFALYPLCLPLFLTFANAISSVFENARNEKYCQRAGQVLNERQIMRVAIVGSYGKTSVKNIAKTILSEKYAVIETPESYNTPMGIAKTVFEADWQGKEVFLAEMGARKQGDIEELCTLVKPDFAIFTGVCEQHIATFGSIEGVWAEKKKILQTGATSVCGANLRQWAESEFGKSDTVTFLEKTTVRDLCCFATHTRFVLSIGGEEIEADIPLLGESAAENVALAAMLAWKMGLTVSEIRRGIEKLQPIAHRLQLLQENGVSIIDDAYNGNPIGAKRAIDALRRFEGRKCIVTPGLVECGVLETSVNATLGEQIANANLDRVVLVGETLISAVKTGYLDNGGEAEKLVVVPTLEAAQTLLRSWLQSGDAVLFLNDLPDVYIR